MWLLKTSASSTKTSHPPGSQQGPFPLLFATIPPVAPTLEMPLIDPVTMSSSSPAGKASGAHSPAVKPLQPVAADVSVLSQGLRHAVPPILLAVFASTFSRLVADPVPTMALNLAVAGGWQVAYCLLCLPVAGASSGAASRKPRPGEKKRASDSAGPNMAVVCVP